MKPFSAELRGFPLIDQHADHDTNQDNDCGPASVCMVQCWEDGIAADDPRAPTPVTARQAILGAALGTTSADELAAYLKRRGIHAAVSRPASYPERTVWWRLLRDHPTIVLIWNRVALHWVAVIGRTSGTVTYADPWSGSAVVLTHQQFASLYRGTLILIG